VPAHRSSGVNEPNVVRRYPAHPAWRPDQDSPEPLTLEVTPTTTSNDDER